MTDSRLAFEKELWESGLQVVAGVDEAGRGPLAGPVVAAAVVLPPTWQTHIDADPSWQAVTDSKKLTARRREELYQRLHASDAISVAVAQAEPARIDEINILNATHEAMRAALAQLSPSPDCVLVDGRPVKTLPWPQKALIKGDGRSSSIAAASIVAKVTRDRLMERYETLYPGYGFAQHKGYPTQSHRDALARLGPCPLHRKSFSPVGTGG